MAGTITFSNSDTRAIQKYTISWTSDASGDATSNTVVLSGSVARINFVPGSGATQPTDLYDITLKDSDGIDILLGSGADLSNTIATTMIPLISSNRIVINEKLAIAVSNSGNAKTGTITIYLNREK